MNEETSTLSRWSRLKRQAEVDEVAAVAPELGVQLDTAYEAGDLPEAVSDANNASEVQTVDAEPLLSDEDMPELTALTSQSDISIFFNRGVSNALRSAALKTIFQLPQYNIRDGLNDYDEDYTYFEPLGDTVTCDMKFHKERKEREAREAEEREALLAEQEAADRADEVTEDESPDTESQESDTAQEESTSTDQDQDTVDTQDDTQLDNGDDTGGEALHADSQSVTGSSKLADNTVDV